MDVVGIVFEFYIAPLYSIQYVDDVFGNKAGVLLLILQAIPSLCLQHDRTVT